MEHHTIYGTIRSIDKFSAVTCSRQMLNTFFLSLMLKEIRGKSALNLLYTSGKYLHFI